VSPPPAAAPEPAEPPPAAGTEPPSDLARVVRALDEGRQLAERHDRPDLGSHLTQARRRLGEQVLGVAVVGEFKRGKSTLVNAVLQTDVCPTDADVVTAVPTVIRYGTEPTATAQLEPAERSAADPAGTDGPGTVEEPVDVDRLAELVSEAADPGWRRRLRSVEVRLPHRLLRTGLSLVDTPGVGGLESAHGIVTLGALRTTRGVIFVTDASQELTGPEVAFLRQALERCPVAVCVVTKTDLYPAWRRIVELDRQHLAEAGIDLPVVPVSSFLRLRAWRSPALNEESGFALLFDWLRSAVLEAAATAAVAAASRDLDFAQEQLRLEVAAEQQVLAEPEASAEVVGALRRRSERTRKLVERGNGWQQFLFDGIDQLIADVKHDLAGRMRAVVRSVEAVIDEGDPKVTWPDIEVWLQRQVVRAANENHELLTERAAVLAAEVAETFALESEEPLELGLTAPVEVLRGLRFDPAQLAAPDSQKLMRMLFAGRAALIPVTVAGSAASFVVGGSLLLLAAAAPVVALGVGFIGRKLIRDERERQLTYRRQQAKMACRRYLDEANFVIEKDCTDSLRRTRRELRDEFQARAGVLHASSQRALSSAERATALGPREREQRAAELADRRAEIERLGRAEPAASRGAA
jgi:GTPase SAR1 family protein